MIILSVIFILLAAACNAVMDVLLYHFDTSVFKHLDRQFFDPCISWYNKYNGGRVENGQIKWSWWNVIFSLFYDKILNRK